MPAAVIVLQKGDGWKLNHHSNRPGLPPTATSSSGAVERFRVIAAQFNSAAVWLPETGFLVTDDPSEAAKHFPYEEWRDQALRETGII